MTLLYTVIAFGLMIFIHELGHFLAAKWCGVGIEKFSLGFGKALFKTTRGGIEYRIGWIPLGGYVKMKGENLDDPDTDANLSFRQKAWWKKILIAFSGPFANLVFGLFLFIFSLTLPLRIEDQLPVVHKAEGKWAEAFLPGDSLVAFNEHRIKGYTEFLEYLLVEKEGRIQIDRKGQKVFIPIARSESESLAVSLYPKVGTRIGEVVPKTPAYHANLKAGDIITAIDSMRVYDWYAMRELIISSPHDRVRLSLKRGDKELVKDLPLESSLATNNQKAIGILQYQPVSYIRRNNAVDAVKLGAANSVGFIALNYKMLFELVQRPVELQKTVGGPVMIATVSQQVGSKGFAQLLLFFGSISLMLMIMNLLPIPILDGGMILFALIEAVIGRPLPLRVQSILQSIGFLLLMSLMILAFYGDISSLVLRSLAR